MKYSIDRDEPIGPGIRRMYANLAGQTAKMLAPPPREIHDSIQKALKGVRFMQALLQAVESPLGPDLYKKENLLIQQVGSLLSGLRNANVSAAILNYVALEAHSVNPADLGEGIKELKMRAEQALEEVLEETREFDTVAVKLKDSKKRTEQWPEIQDSIEALIPGVARGYQTGRNDFRSARESTSGDTLDAWREQVECLKYHNRILVHYWPDTLGINGKSLQQLSEYIGEERDLALLENTLNDLENGNKIGNTGAIMSYIDQKRSFLRRSAFNLGDYIYSSTAEEFTRSFTRSADLAG